MEWRKGELLPRHLVPADDSNCDLSGAIRRLTLTEFENKKEHIAFQQGAAKPMSASAHAVVADLRDRIRQFDGRAQRDRAVLPFGVPEIDERLPGGGLALASLHEICGGGNDAVEGAAAMLFAAGIAARTKGQVLWCLTRPDLFAPALAQAGLAPGRVIYVEAGDEKSLLLCFEEGLAPWRARGRGGRGGAPVDDRLAAPAAGGGGRRHARSCPAPLQAPARRRNAFAQPSAAVTRWRVSVRPSVALPVPGIGRAQWLLQLCAAGPARRQTLTWRHTDAEGRIAFSSRLADRSPEAGARRLRRLRLISGSCLSAVTARAAS
jgi:protein ImuA